MFAARQFARRFFPGRYFPPAGEGVEPPDPPVESGGSAPRPPRRQRVRRSVILLEATPARVVARGGMAAVTITERPRDRPQPAPAELDRADELLELALLLA